MKKSLLRIFSLVLVIVSGICLFSGCAKYKAHKLAEPIGIAHQKNNVQITAEALSNADCHHYFSRKAVSKGYQPIQLCIKNASDEPYVLDVKNIDLQVEDRKSVAHALHLNTTGRVVGWGLPGLALWPFFIPAAIEGVKSSDANKKLDNDFNQRVLTDNSRLVIAPGSSMNKVFFVTSENFKNTFNLALKNKHSKESLSFRINV